MFYILLLHFGTCINGWPTGIRSSDIPAKTLVTSYEPMLNTIETSKLQMSQCKIFAILTNQNNRILNRNLDTRNIDKTIQSWVNPLYILNTTSWF